MKLLVADDDDVSRMMLKAMVARAGYEPVAVADGQSACDLLLQSDAPRLAILDWMMPGMDGVDVCRKVREVVTSDPPYLILLTSRDRQSDIVQGLKSGANDYIIKPYDVEELSVRVAVGRRVVDLQAQLAGRITELQNALEHVKTLQGILPICMYCKKIRDDKQYWQDVESYVAHHSDAEFSHSICPDCYQKYVVPQLKRVKAETKEI